MTDINVLKIKETTTPTATADYGKFYCQSNNKAYFQDGAGSEHELAFASTSTLITWNVLNSGDTLSPSNGYFCDTSSAGFTVTMPATPSIGDTVYIVDLARTFSDTNKELTINFNSEKHEGETGTYIANISGARLQWTYSNSTYGWKRIN